MEMINMTKRVLSLMLVATFILGSFSVCGLKDIYAAQEKVAAEVVNINKAGIEELQAVRGIGPSLAERIIQFRNENGPFQQVDDLIKVRGIGAAKLEKMKDQISVK